MTLQIISLDAASHDQREDAAEILMTALGHCPSAWHDMPSARDEVGTFLNNPDRFSFAALEGGRLMGWIGGIRQSRYVWELHPLVVRPQSQRRGYGRLLVQALEAAARGAGVCTIWLGTDDDFGGTNLFGVDLYPDVLEKLAHLAPATDHPFTFYRAQGYAVVGVLPDADGPGKHDILMAKRIGPPEPQHPEAVK